MNIIPAMIVTVVCALLFAAVRFLAMKHSSEYGSCGMSAEHCKQCGGCNVHDYHRDIKVDINDEDKE